MLNKSSVIKATKFIRRNFNRALIIIAAQFFSLIAVATEFNYMVIDNQARPFQIEDDVGKHSGIITEIINNIFIDSDHTVNIITLPFNRMISILESGKIKNWLTFGSPIWKSVPIQSESLSDSSVYQVKHSILYLKEHSSGYQNISDLYGKSLILLMGFDYPGLNPYLSSGKIKEIRVKDFDAAFNVMKRLKTVAFVEMDVRLKYNIKQLNMPSSQFHFDDFSKIIEDYYLHIAIDPTISDDDKRFINSRINELKSNGKIAEIISRYN